MNVKRIQQITDHGEDDGANIYPKIVEPFLPLTITRAITCKEGNQVCKASMIVSEGHSLHAANSRVKFGSKTIVLASETQDRQVGN